jgi:hypothetical protein
MARSRRWNGWCEFSARLFKHRPVCAYRSRCLECRSIWHQAIGHDPLGLAMPLQRFPEESQYRLLVAALRHEAFERFTFIVDSPPKLVANAVDLHENFVEIPLPMREISHRLNAVPLYFGCKESFRTGSTRTALSHA